LFTIFLKGPLKQRVEAVNQSWRVISKCLLALRRCPALATRGCYLQSAVRSSNATGPARILAGFEAGITAIDVVELTSAQSVARLNASSSAGVHPQTARQSCDC
jgi:hypothetical protein